MIYVAFSSVHIRSKWFVWYEAHEEELYRFGHIVGSASQSIDTIRSTT